MARPYEDDSRHDENIDTLRPQAGDANTDYTARRTPFGSLGAGTAAGQYNPYRAK
jgi:hypothetical protein